MRNVMRTGLALLLALGYTTSAAAQTTERLSLNALVGPSFANVGTTFSTVGQVEFKLTDYFSFAGEGGILPRAPFRDATVIAPAASFETADSLKVNAYHWNGNVKVRPFLAGAITPYVTAGVGSFSADTVGRSRQVDGVWIQDRRRATDFATNVGAGMMYRVHDWIGLGADYRTFFVHRDKNTPRVQRFTAGLSLFLD